MVRRSSSSSSKRKIVLNKRSIISYERKASNSPSTSDDSTESTTMSKGIKVKSSNTNKKKMNYCNNRSDALSKKLYSASTITATNKTITINNNRIIESATITYQWGFPGHLSEVELHVYVSGTKILLNRNIF